MGPQGAKSKTVGLDQWCSTFLPNGPDGQWLRSGAWCLGQMQWGPSSCAKQRKGPAWPWSSYAMEGGLVLTWPYRGKGCSLALKGEWACLDSYLRTGVENLAMGDGGSINCDCSPTAKVPNSWRALQARWHDSTDWIWLTGQRLSTSGLYPLPVPTL